MFAALLCVLAALPPAAARSNRLTAAAEQLLECEKKITTADVDSVLFTDVVSLLDVAVETYPQNLHAHALRGELLLHQSYDGEGQYDVCFLLDARSDAEFVISRAARATPADVTIARAVLRGIENIPPDAIPDPPSSCNDEDEGQRGTRTKSR